MKLSDRSAATQRAAPALAVLVVLVVDVELKVVLATVLLVVAFDVDDAEAAVLAPPPEELPHALSSAADPSTNSRNRRGMSRSSA
jgi:hypothetical protein